MDNNFIILETSEKEVSKKSKFNFSIDGINEWLISQQKISIK